MLLSNKTLSPSTKMRNYVKRTHLKQRLETENPNFKELKKEVIMESKSFGKGSKIEDVSMIVNDLQTKILP